MKNFKPGNRLFLCLPNSSKPALLWLLGVGCDCALKMMITKRDGQLPSRRAVPHWPCSRTQ